MCLPENVNQFSCPRCNVQLARPGFTQSKSTPVAVRCGNTQCDFLMTIPGNIQKFRCPRCSMEQVLPGTEEALKAKARIEEEIRQANLKKKQEAELADLCKLFSNMDPTVVAEVYQTSEQQRTIALASLIEMVGSSEELDEAMIKEVDRMAQLIHFKRNIVYKWIRCPISGDIMEDPVIAADGYSYERKNIENWIFENDSSPMTDEPLKHKDLVSNHQLRGQIQSWIEQEEDAKMHSDEGGSKTERAVIPAVRESVSMAGGPGQATLIEAVQAVQLQGMQMGPGGLQDSDEDTDAGVEPRYDQRAAGGPANLVERMVQSLGITPPPVNGAKTREDMPTF